MSRLLWQPSPERVRGSNMYRFMEKVNQAHGTRFQGYDDLYRWSVDHIPDFWARVWDFTGIRSSAPYTEVVDDPLKMPGAKWFSGARLNFAENLLRHRDDHTALVFCSEGERHRLLTYAQLYAGVAKTAAALKALGIAPGDRVAGFMPNMPEAVIAMLAAASLGAVWSSCSPDFGAKSVLDRFGQSSPKVLFAADGYFFKGKAIDSLPRIREVCGALSGLEKVVIVPYTRPDPEIGTLEKAVLFSDFQDPDARTIDFVQLPFDHPLYIMYSSGTTGPPKSFVQGAGGVLIQQLKEQVLHTGLTRDDTIFYFTTCGWMMWNWLTSALATGATVALYDGSPFHPGPGVLWRYAEKEGFTVFGTSAGYLAALRDSGFCPGDSHNLSPLKTLLSTGSPLSPDGFDFVYGKIKADLQLASISGGTDINSCFVLGNPMGPVYAGEIQCRGLGVRVAAYDEQGRAVVNRSGELVCEAAIPSMPLYFWNDPDGEKYRQAYFGRFPGVWTHGDFIQINDNGGVVIFGRSDATLNPGGVRIGTAEIYRQVETLDEVEDALVVGQNWKNDVRVILFVKPAPGHELTDALKEKIRAVIRANASPRHVPAKIVAAPDIPYTLNMKKVELAVKKILDGKDPGNRDALKNPESLDFFMGLEDLIEHR
ncbi:acetoacetate--CoA ligase [Desulfosudis oleivorans]|uniref:Acetoacetyl-CoA synthase n=1 Tax=Desulfosudis oleivorans (strain DSM 6200 / JCM 39069 / Hxd3) TaxID=96561 RepID=A8ZY46_DESOH|nr:acetoacetate--CoA ligase [Desulfosudis oleivorans]ABW67053.1 acetoacetyl-CoA synthase [Desulfosudis oleivorans Hxd3]